MTHNQEIIEAFYDCRSLHIGYREVVGDGKTAVLKFQNTIVAWYDSSKSDHLIIETSDTTPDPMMEMLDCAVKRYGCRLTRLGSAWMINGVPWDGAKFNVPKDLKSDWVSQVVGVETAEAAQRIRKGQILKGTKYVIEGACKLSQGVVVCRKGVCMGGVVESFLQSVYTAHPVFFAFIKECWVSQRGALSKYYDLDSIPMEAIPITVLSNGSIILMHGVEFFGAKLRRECQLPFLTKPANKLLKDPFFSVSTQ